MRSMKSALILLFAGQVGGDSTETQGASSGEAVTTDTTEASCTVKSIIVTIDNESGLTFDQQYESGPWETIPSDVLEPSASSTGETAAECATGVSATVTYTSGVERFTLSVTDGLDGTSSIDLSRKVGPTRLHYGVSGGADVPVALTVSEAAAA